MSKSKQKETIEQALEVEEFRKSLMPFLDEVHILDLGFGKATFRPAAFYINANDDSRMYLEVPVHVTTKADEYHLRAALPPFRIGKKTDREMVNAELIKWIVNPFVYWKSSSYMAYYHCLLCDGVQTKSRSVDDYARLDDLDNVLTHKKMLLRHVGEGPEAAEKVRHIVGHVTSYMIRFFQIAQEVPMDIFYQLNDFVEHIPSEYYTKNFITTETELAMWAKKEHPGSRDRFGLTSFYLMVKDGKCKRINRTGSKVMNLIQELAI